MLPLLSNKNSKKTPNEKDTTIEEKILYYNRANRQVAILCNHKKSVPKKFSEQIDKLEYKVDVIQEEIDMVREAIKKAKGKKVKRTDEEEEMFEMRRERIEAFEALEEEKLIAKEAEKEKQDKLKQELGKLEPKESESAKKKGFTKSDPNKDLPDDLEKLKRRLEKLEESVHKQEIQKQQKEENCEVALGTSKINYNDPRITVAWTKKFNVPLEKVFSATLRKKFPWAQVAKSDFEF